MCGKKLKLVYGALLLGFGMTLSAAPTVPAKSTVPSLPSNQPATLNAIDSDATPGTSLINIRFNKKPSLKNLKLESHGSFLQLNLPNTIVAEPGKFYDLQGGKLSKAAVFQINEKDSALRLFVNTDASNVLKATTADILGDRIAITVDHKKLAGIVAKDPATTAVTGLPTADQIVKSTNVATDIPAPSGVLAEKNPTIAHANAFDFKSKLYTVALFSGIMLLALLILYFAKPILLRKKLGGQDVNVPTIKTIATQALGPKQKLALIQVGDEQLLIGVGQDSIQLIKTINQNTPSVQTSMPAPTQMAQENNPYTLEPTKPRRIKGAITKQPKPKPQQPRPIKPQNDEVPGTSFEARISDDGIEQKRRPRSAVARSKPDETIQDVTRIIREKLKHLPSV